MVATPPWKKKRPVESKPTKLTPARKKAAAARAKKAGRTYPNLVDNMWAAKKTKTLQKTTTTKKTAPAAAKKRCARR